MFKFNEQPPEKVEHGDGSTLNVHSIFDTIQGEGPYSGQRAVFVRLAGCNLQCPLCDTDYTRDREQKLVGEILEDISRLNSKAQLIVITGGEPFRQNISTFVKMLLSKGFKIQVETNGTLYLEDFPYESTTIVCSPKTPAVNSRIENHISAYKYVISNDYTDSDYLPIKVLGLQYDKPISKPKEDVPVYVQPCDHKHSALNERNLKTCIEAAKEQGYILNVQLHKIIGVE